jgi:hypothetical protein
MDQYGCLKVDRTSADEVRDSLNLRGSVVFPLSGDQIGCMIIHIDTMFEKIGVMPFGGNPIGRVYVGVYGRGCNHLSKEHIHPGYISEKLNLHQDDAETFSKFWDLLWNVK